MPSVVILRRAEVELMEACEWYEEQQLGLSLKFRTFINDRINFIAQNPLLYPSRIRSEFRVVALKKYPFLIVYWHEQATDTVFITSIFHTKRDPQQLK